MPVKNKTDHRLTVGDKIDVEVSHLGETWSVSGAVIQAINSTSMVVRMPDGSVGDYKFLVGTKHLTIVANHGQTTLV